MVPHVAARKTHQRLLKFSFVTPKRLLQQYLGAVFSNSHQFAIFAKSLLPQRFHAHRLIPEFETIREASMACAEAETALKGLTAHPQDFGKNLPETDPLVIAAKKHLDKMAAEFTRLQELQAVRTAAWQSASGALAACEDWLRHGVPGGCTLEAVEVEPPKLLKGETVIDGIERLRRRVRELKADLHRIASAPFPSSYCKQRMREQIEQAAERGAPSVSRLVELSGPVEFQTQRLTSEVHGERRPLAFTEVPDIALVAWLHRDLLIKRLDELIDSEADDPAAALSHEARQKAEAEVMGDVLDIERQEAALVWAAQDQKFPCEHRADCSAMAIWQCHSQTMTNGGGR